MSSSGFNFFLNLSGTKVDLLSAFRNGLQDQNLLAILDLAKVVHTYAEVISERYGQHAGLGKR